MKRLLSLGVVSMFIGMTAMTLPGRQDRAGNEAQECTCQQGTML